MHTQRHMPAAPHLPLSTPSLLSTDLALEHCLPSPTLLSKSLASHVALPSLRALRYLPNPPVNELAFPRINAFP